MQCECWWQMYHRMYDKCRTAGWPVDKARAIAVAAANIVCELRCGAVEGLQIVIER